jgi:putative oxidoreductase
MQSNTQVSATSAVTDWAALAGRVLLAGLFLWSAYAKLVYMDGNVGYMKAYGMPAAELLIWPALLLELAGGAMLLLGWKARWAALALVLFTIPATFIFHAYWGVPADQVLNQQIHFMKNLAILGGLFSVIAHGAGRIALDRAGAADVEPARARQVLA